MQLLFVPTPNLCLSGFFLPVRCRRDLGSALCLQVSPSLSMQPLSIRRLRAVDVCDARAHLRSGVTVRVRVFFVNLSLAGLDAPNKLAARSEF